MGPHQVGEGEGVAHYQEVEGVHREGEGEGVVLRQAMEEGVGGHQGGREVVVGHH